MPLLLTVHGMVIKRMKIESETVKLKSQLGKSFFFATASLYLTLWAIIKMNTVYI